MHFHVLHTHHNFVSATNNTITNVHVEKPVTILSINYIERYIHEMQFFEGLRVKVVWERMEIEIPYQN